MIKKTHYSAIGVVIVLTVVSLSVIALGNFQPAKEVQGIAPTRSLPPVATSVAFKNPVQKLSSPKVNKPTGPSGKVGPASFYPDPLLTPGDVLSIDTSKICVSGYTSTVRDVPLSVKKRVYAEYGVSYPQATGVYEVDHFIPLEIGGSNDIKNLWLEPASPTPGFHQKDQYENYSHTQACSGTTTIQEVQRRMVTDWYKYWLQETGAIPVSTSNIQATGTVIVTPISSSPNTAGPQVKKSASGICHEKGSTYYDRTENYTPYNSLTDCLASGGRLPKQ